MAPNVALMQLLTKAADEESARDALNEMCRNRLDATSARRLANLKSLWRQSPELFPLLKTIAELADSGARSAKDWADVFDRAAARNAEASVALYSLGDTRLLARITDELVCRIAQWGLLKRDFRILDLGCGTGRIAKAAAPHVQSVVAIDCSETMARLTCRGTLDKGNVYVLRTPGEDLALFADGTFDTILAVDSFPYLVEARTAERHLCEIDRILKAGGRVLIMNYSYRGDLAHDRADIGNFARQFGFRIRRNGTSDLTLWDGKAFLLQKT